MRRLLVLEEQKTWKREFGFDRIETAAEMDEKRFHTSPVSEPFFYRSMFNPRRPHTPDEFTLEMKVDVERLRMEIVLSQPAPPQCDLLPRRAAVDTGSEEPGTPRRSPAIGTGSDEPGVLRFETSTDMEEIFPLETSVDGFLHSNCTSPKQECSLLQPDVGVDEEKETTATSQQAVVCEEFARPTKSSSGKGRQLGRPSKANSSTRGGRQ